jgi:hypothetical protein
MPFKLKFATTPPSEDLCDSCKNCNIIRGHNGTDVIKFCAGAPGGEFRVPFKVGDCDYFIEANAFDTPMELLPAATLINREFKPGREVPVISSVERAAATYDQVEAAELAMRKACAVLGLEFY